MHDCGLRELVLAGGTYVEKAGATVDGTDGTPLVGTRDPHSLVRTYAEDQRT